MRVTPPSEPMEWPGQQARGGGTRGPLCLDIGPVLDGAGRPRRSLAGRRPSLLTACPCPHEETRRADRMSAGHHGTATGTSPRGPPQTAGTSAMTTDVPCTQQAPRDGNRERAFRDPHSPFDDPRGQVPAQPRAPRDCAMGRPFPAAAVQRARIRGLPSATLSPCTGPGAVPRFCGHSGPLLLWSPEAPAGPWFWPLPRPPGSLGCSSGLLPLPRVTAMTPGPPPCFTGS